MKKIKLRLVLAVARWCNVPVDVNYAFWAELKNEAKTSTCLTAPK